MTQLIASSGCPPSDNLFNTGSRNAAVLPVPVCATAIKSLPSSMIGIACSCIGVHSSNRMASSASSTFAFNCSSENFILLFNLSAKIIYFLV